MQLQYTPYVLPLLVTVAVSVALALYARRRRHRPGAAAVALLMLAAAEWALAYALELGSVDLPSKLFWGNVAYLGVVVVPVAWLVFVLQYTGRAKWLTRRNMVLLSIVPLASLLLVWTNEIHRLYYSDVRLDTSGLLPALGPTYGVWFWIDIAYQYLLILLSTLLLLRAFVRSPRLYRRQVGTLLIGAFIPWVAEVLLLSGLSPSAPLDLTPFAFTLSGLVFAWGLFRYRLLDIVPVARDAVIEGMSDGVIVLDTQNRIVDLNPAAERIIGRPASEAIGQPIGIANLGMRVAELEAQDFHSEISTPRSAMTFDLRASPLYDQRGRLAGRLVVLRDITGRLLESEERYRSLFEGVPVGLYRITPEGQIIAANPALVEMLGYPDRESLLAVNVTAGYADPEDRSRWQVLMERGGIVRDFEVQVRRRDGTTIWVEDTARAVRDASGRVLYYEGSLEDITGRKRVEEALQESRVQLERSHEQLADRVAALEGLHRIGVVMSSQLEAGALLQFIVEQAAKLTGAVSCSILLPDETTGELVFHAADAPVVGMRVPPGQGVAARVLRERTAQIVHDVTNDPDHYARVGQECSIPTRSLLAAPLLLGDEAIGVLEAVNKRQGRFAEQDRDLLMTLASHAAIAIENARLYEDARQRLAEAELVQEVMLATVSTLDFDLALERTVKALHRALSVDHLNFLLPNEQGDRLVPHPSLVSPAEGAFPVSIEGSLAGRAYRTGQPVWVRELGQQPVYSDQAPEVRAALAVPVRVGDHVIAVLHAGSPQVGAFGEDKLRLFTTVAGQLGVTLENTRLHEQVQRHATELEGRVQRRTFDLQVLHDLSREIGQIRSFDELVRLVLKNLYRAMPHDVSAGILVMGDQRQLFIQPTRPLAPAVQEEIQGRLTRTLSRIRGEEIGMVQEGVLSQTLASEVFDAAQQPMVRLASAFQVPFIVGEEIAGLLFVGSEREEAFSEHQMRLLYTIANQASLFLSIRRSEEALQQRAKLETLIADVSTLFVRLPPEEFDTGMESALRAVGEFAAADRGYILLLSDGGARGDNVHEWCAEGIAPQIENRRELRVERFPRLAERLSQVTTVHAPRIKAIQLPRVADLPPEARAEKEFLQSQDVQSLVAVPMIYGGTLVGFIGFDAVRAEKRWTENTIALLGIVGDICVNALERKRAQEQIEIALKEKEVLLQEIHHRVKNNLQVVSSLLDLQSRYIKDEQTSQMFRESRSRVRSMALIHEKLYRSGDLARIDFAEYIQSLAESLFRSYRTRTAGVTLHVNVEDVLLDVDAAIPCGLIINELLSNALKYAFPDDREGEICVELFAEDGRFTLVVRDNGVGFPRDLDFRKTDSLGLKLVTTLVKQLGGTIQLDRRDGTAFRITFSERRRKAGNESSEVG